MMIPTGARLTEFAGVYRFDSERYFVTAVFSPSAKEYFVTAETITGDLASAITRRAELLDDLHFKHTKVDNIGPPRRRRMPGGVRRRPPRELTEEEE